MSWSPSRYGAEVGRRGAGVGRRGVGVGRRGAGVGRRGVGVGRRGAGVGRRGAGVGRHRGAVRSTAAAFVAGVCALALASCGWNVVGSARAGAGGPVRSTGGGAPTVRTNELVTPPGPEERAPVHASAAAALRAFAEGYINWDAADVAARLGRLADDSVGQARSAMQLAAAQTRADPELVRAGVANRGSVGAVAALAGEPNRYVVVTRESTTAAESSAYQGLAPAWHLTLATVARRGGGWVISGWQPQS